MKMLQRAIILGSPLVMASFNCDTEMLPALIACSDQIVKINNFRRYKLTNCLSFSPSEEYAPPKVDSQAKFSSSKIFIVANFITR